MSAASEADFAQKLTPGSENIVLKGYKSGLTLIIPEAEPFENFLAELKAYLEHSQDFFRGAKLFLKTGNRVFQPGEQNLLLDLIKSFGLIPQPMEDDGEATVRAGRQIKENREETESFVPTITVKKTVRSGQRVIFEGNVIIKGDVNPGAEVVASGDIIVLGRLRGTAHAGARGDISSQIIAFQFKPVQIRIAGVITRAPEQDSGADPNRSRPEVAFIKNGKIIVEP
ncbi:MAG TPA: septum site-determining protein MinC, partial [Bacillota bacterium]|nr:septum site-determining protein MinC [Bacillota bacterium]